MASWWKGAAAAVEAELFAFFCVLGVERFATGLCSQQPTVTVQQEVMRIILEQAQAAAEEPPNQARASDKHLSKIQKLSAPDSGNRIFNKKRARPQNDCRSSGRGAGDHQDLAAGTKGDGDLNFYEQLVQEVVYAVRSKAVEKLELERQLKDIKEGVLANNSPKPGADFFYERMFSLKQLVGGNIQFSVVLETFEQTYKSDESKCWMIRKELEDLRSKLISECLEIKGDETATFQGNFKEIMSIFSEVEESEDTSHSNFRNLPDNDLMSMDGRNLDGLPPEDGFDDYVLPSDFEATASPPMPPASVLNGQNSTTSCAAEQTSFHPPSDLSERAEVQNYQTPDYSMVSSYATSNDASVAHNSTHTGCPREDDGRPFGACANTNAGGQFYDGQNSDYERLEHCLVSLTDDEWKSFLAQKAA